MVKDGKLYYWPLTEEEVLTVVYGCFSGGRHLDLERASEAIVKSKVSVSGLGVVGVRVDVIDEVRVDCRLQGEYIFVDHYKDKEMVVDSIEKAKMVKNPGYAVVKDAQRVWKTKHGGSYAGEGRV